MKRIITTAGLCLFVLSLMAQESRIQGKIENYKGGIVLFLHVFQGAQQEDTIKVNEDGTFDYRFSVDLPGRAYITCMDEMASIPLFIEKGMEANLDIDFHQENFEDAVMNFADVDYQGDYADCFYFMKEYEEWNRNAWTFERMDTLTFFQYSNLLLNPNRSLETELALFLMTAIRKMWLYIVGS